MAFRKSYILSGKNLHIVFQSGSLNGMDFECEFNPDGVEEILKDDDGNPMLKDGKEQINPMSQVFEIVANEDYGRFLPDITLHPKDGDTFVLYNWDSTKLGDTLVSSASNELLTDAIKDLKKSMIDPTTYTCTAEANYSYNQGRGNLHGVGDRVNLYNKGYGDSHRSSRVIGYEFCLDIPYDGAKYYVGEKPSYSRLNAMESKIEELVYNGQSYLNGNGGGGKSIYIIKSYDKTAPTDYNVYSAKAIDEQRLNRTKDDTAHGTITFEKVQKFLQGLAIGESGKHYIDKNGGASLSDVVVDRIHDAASTPSDRVIIGAQGFDLYMGDDGKSHMYLDNIVVRQKFFASSAEIRKISYSGGTTIFSNAGSTLAKVSVIFDADGNCIGYKCYACADDGTTRTMNWWRIGMMALCQTFNVKAGKNEKLQNRYYWRLVVGVGQEILDDGKLYDYVVLSNKEKFLGSESIVPTYANKLVTADGTNMLVFGDYGIEVSAAESMGSMAGILMKLEDKETDEGGNLIANRYFYGYESGIAQDAPAEGDVIVQVGDQICWKSRGNLIKISTSTEDNATDNAPAITMYHNLGALYSTGKKDSAGMEIISPYQWKTCTCVISPEQVKFNANNFMWFTEDPEKPFSPITVFYNIETNGMFRVGSSGRLYGDNVENGTAKVSVCCYKVMGDTKDVLDECWWESSCQDIKIDSPYTGRTDLQTNDAAAQNLPAYFTLDCYTLSVTADGTKHRGDVLLATMDIPVLKDGDKGEKGDKGDKGEQGEQGLRGLQGETGEQGIPGTPGKDGKTTYFHIKYSSEANPTTAAQMTETPNTYIGTYVDFLPNDSTDPNVYTWSRFEGLQGKDGTNGIPGKNGADGRTSYLHIKYSNDGGQTLTVNDGETPGSWIGQYTDYEQKDSTNVTKYTWSKIKGEQGDKGDDAVSYSVQFSIVNDTVNGVTSQRLYVTFTKSVGSNITSGTIGKIGFYGRAKVYLDGEENGVMSSELSRDYPYIDIGDKGHADTIKGKKNLSVELIDANGKIVASNTFFFAEKGDKGENAIRLALTNENSSVSCDKNGNPIGTVQGTIAILYDGAVAANADRVTYSIVSHDGLSVIPEINAGGAIDNIEIRGGNTSLKASINIKAVYENQAYYATYTITKVLAGSDGTPAIIYWIEPSATAIKVDSDGNANPSTITCKQYKQVGAESPVAGDKKIYYRHNAMDSTLWNEYTEAINPATNVDAYEFVLADKTPSNSSAIIYDRESIPVIKDGQNGNDGLSGNGIVPAYIRSKDNPTPPTSTDKNNLDNGWSLAIPSVADVKNVSYSDSSWTDYSDDSYTWKKSPTTAANSTSWCLVTFTTTQANQTVMFVIKSFSEKKYDYIFLSEIDASNVPSKPGIAGASRAVSGNGVELSITDVVATAGTHTVYICYGKDASGDYNGDYGLFRIESMAGIPLWQSNGKEVFTREDNGTIKSKIESWSEPFKVTGENGEDAVSYTVTLTRGSNSITQGLYVGVTRYIGTACTTGTIIDFGMSCKAYTDGTLAEGLTDRLQTSDNYIDFAAFPKAKSFTVELFDKNGNKVATGNYSSGDDAISILVEDAPLVFDTDDSGTVPASVTKTAKVKVMKGNTNVADDCTQLTSRDDLSSNCMCNVEKDEDNGCISVYVQGNWISKNDVIVDGVNQGQVSATSGYVVAQFVYAGVVYSAQVPFSVNVAKFTGSVVANNKKFETKFTEISNRFEKTPTNDDLTKAEARITQTAREISLSVSEKSVGRRNMLVGSAFRKYGDGFMYMSGGYYDGYPLEQIEKNSGIDGVNCIHCRTKQTGTNEYYLSGFRWNGISPQGNIKLEKGKNYVLSFYAKTHTPNDIYFHAEVLYQGSKIDTSRPAGYAGPTGYSTTFSASEADKWELFTVKVSVPPDALYEYVEINIFGRARSYSFVGGYICKPMLEEGENYNGWTLSEQDYDYVGGNLLDNARTLDKSGTLIESYDTVIQNGYGTDSACIKNLMKANATPSDYKEVLRYSFGSTYLVNGNDYIFSFVAKADVDNARVVCYMWSGDIENSCNIFTEGNGGAWDSKGDGNIVFILSRQWTRYWVHWRPKDGYATPKEVIIRHTGNNNTYASTVYVTQPKLEIGATMTEWTERKTDLVDKASLKAAGIEITSEKVKLYGDQIEFAQTKSGTAFAMFKDGMLDARLINAAKIIAERLETSGNTGQRIAIEDGLMQIFGTNGVCNIKFGVNDNGEAILSYYDKNGKWLYDLGPNKLDGSQITNSAVTIKEYVKATIKPGTNDFYDNVTYLGKGVKQVKFQYSQLLFGNNRFMNEDDEIKKNSSAHIGYQPFVNESNVTKLYRYSAPRMGNTIVKDDKYGLSTADLAKRADGKYFTSMTMASGGSLVNLAPVGVYFGKNEAVRYAPYPNASVGSTNDRFPAFTIGGLEISKAGVGSSIGAYNGFYSYLTRKVTNLNTDIIS